jgi:hypothetical protein
VADRQESSAAQDQRERELAELFDNAQKLRERLLDQGRPWDALAVAALIDVAKGDE